jgi:hypothetical protein
MATQTAPERTLAEEIRELARAEAKLFQKWIDAEVEDGEPDAPSVEYWQAFDAWQNAYDRRALPIAAREMATLADEYVAWDMSGESEPPTKFWTARQFASEACLRLPPELPPMQTPAELVAEKVSIRQIATIWRLFQAEGEPDTIRVETELANPGSVLTPEYIERINQRRLAELGFAPAPEWEDEPAEPEPPKALPPSLDQLIADRANVEQIARLKAQQYGTPLGRWLEIIPAMAAAMGVGLAQNSAQVVNEGGQSVSEKIFGEEFVRRGQDIQPQIDETEITLQQDDEEQVTEAAPVDVDAKIIELFQAGQDVTAIGREVDLSPRKVKGVIKRWEDQQRDEQVDEAE